MFDRHSISGFEIIARTPSAHRQAQRAGAGPKQCNGPRILIVEDGAIVAEDLRRRCEANGYRIAGVTASGEDALVTAEASRPDLVLMDIRLKGTMDGIEAARLIRERYDIPVVYATAYSDDATLDRAKRTSPFGYIFKPVESRDLHTTIEMALHRHATEAALRSALQCQSMLLEAFTDPVMLLKPDGSIVACNRLTSTLLGLSRPDDTSGESLYTYVPSAEHLSLRNTLERVMGVGMLDDVEYPARTRDGVDLQVRLALRRMTSGPTDLILLTVRRAHEGQSRTERPAVPRA